MIFGILLVQVLFMFLTIFSPKGSVVMFYDKRIFKNYIILESVFQSICIVVNVAMAFVNKHVMILVLVVDCILISLIQVVYSIKSKRKYFSDLEKYIVAEKLQDLDPIEIRRHLLEKYQQVYFIDDIKKCLAKLGK